MSEASPGSLAEVRVERWPSEIPLLICVALASAAIWFLLAISIIGLFYVVFIGAFLFFGHVAFVAHLRGSAVRLGPDQFPELHGRVTELAHQAGIHRVPDAYLVQAGGALNALATKFLRSRMIVLYSDLLEACGENRAARDMIIGHELGHIRAGHLTGLWLLFPGLIVPFLGSAYSRAREYTCDRYGTALCGDRSGGLLGLAILAAGGTYGPRVNLAGLARQREDLDTGWMTLGAWLAGHPPLAERIAALDASLVGGSRPLVRGPLRAVAILAGVALLPAAMVGAFVAAGMVSSLGTRALEGPTARIADVQPTALSEQEIDAYLAQVDADLEQLRQVVLEHRARVGSLPVDENEVHALWEEVRPGEEVPLDPFDGLPYGYQTLGDAFRLYSSGPDGMPGTDDDVSLIEEDEPAEQVALDSAR